jgi:GNAT superfamily N-acetyltransferase
VPLTTTQAVAAVDLQLHPRTRRDALPAVRAAALREELEWAIEVATADLAFARDYQHHMPHPGTAATDYLNRWVDISADLEVLLGPRHRARDLARPFIAVDVASRRIRHTDLQALSAACLREFPRFAPRSVVFWDWEQPDHWPEASPDMRLLAGPLATVRSGPMPAGLSVAPAEDTSFYDRYRTGYDDLLRQRPEAGEWTQPSELPDLENLQQQDLVLEARVDGEWAGLIAGQPGARAGIRGIEVNEIFLLPQYRGRGFGAALSTALARHVRLPDTDFLLGTVHWQNRAARSAAQAAGRQDRGGEVVIPLMPNPAEELPVTQS